MKAEKLRTLIEYDPRTGLFTWLIKRRSHGGKISPGATAGSWDKQGRLRIMIDQRMYSAPRLAWLFMTGKLPPAQIDHIDGNPRNNVFSNLRLATAYQNSQNLKKARSHNKCGLLGVTLQRNGNYTAKIVVKGKPIHLGTFKDKYAAHEAYLAAKRKLHSYGTL